MFEYLQCFKELKFMNLFFYFLKMLCFSYNFTEGLLFGFPILYESVIKATLSDTLDPLIPTEPETVVFLDAVPISGTLNALQLTSDYDAEIVILAIFVNGSDGFVLQNNVTKNVTTGQQWVSLAGSNYFYSVRICFSKLF